MTRNENIYIYIYAKVQEGVTQQINKRQTNKKRHANSAPWKLKSVTNPKEVRFGEETA